MPATRPDTSPPPTPATPVPPNRLIHADNATALRDLINQDVRPNLIYIDPPFDVGADFHAESVTNGRVTKTFAFRDAWADTYQTVMRERLELMRRVLHDDASIVVHCDWRTVAVWRSLLDDSFGRDRFRNEIAWVYGGAARGAKAIAKQFARNHDTLLWYSTSDTWTYNPQHRDIRLTHEQARAKGYRCDERGWFKTAPRGDYTDDSIRRLEDEGRIFRTKTGTVRIRYELESDGDYVVERQRIGDVWDDIPDAMHIPRAERTGYPTQKPERLIERVVAALSNPGDLVADFFAGSGTTGIVADRLHRRWLLVDNGQLAHETATERLKDAGCTFEVSRPA